MEKDYISILKEGKNLYGHNGSIYHYDKENNNICETFYLDADCILHDERRYSEEEFRIKTRNTKLVME